jgi:hypothetical protein
VVFATMMMLAFLVDQTQQLCCALFQAVWAKMGSKQQFPLIALQPLPVTLMLDSRVLCDQQLNERMK